MEWLKRKFQDMADWVGDRFAPKPKEPSPALWNAAYRDVEAASAQLNNAYNEAGTAWAARYKGRDFVVTSAHATLNYVEGSRGFNFAGRQYFVLVKGDQLALAEQLAFNPQGGPCSHQPGKSDGGTMRDLSILRLLAPNETRYLLNEFSYTPDLKTRLDLILTRNPAMARYARDGVLTGEELLTMTERFQMKPIPVDQDAPSRSERIRTPRAYALNYANNRPELARGELLSLEPANIGLHYEPRMQIVPGFSGGLMFDVSETGKLVPLGTAATVSAPTCTGYGVNLPTLREGLDALPALRLTFQELRRICDMRKMNFSHWFLGRGELEAQTLPTQAPHTPHLTPQESTKRCLASAR